MPPTFAPLPKRPDQNRPFVTAPGHDDLALDRAVTAAKGGFRPTTTQTIAAARLGLGSGPPGGIPPDSVKKALTPTPHGKGSMGMGMGNRDIRPRAMTPSVATRMLDAVVPGGGSLPSQTAQLLMAKNGGLIAGTAEACAANTAVQKILPQRGRGRLTNEPQDGTCPSGGLFAGQGDTFSNPPTSTGANGQNAGPTAAEVGGNDVEVYQVIEEVLDEQPSGVVVAGSRKQVGEVGRNGLPASTMVRPRDLLIAEKKAELKREQGAHATANRRAEADSRKHSTSHPSDHHKQSRLPPQPTRRHGGVTASVATGGVDGSVYGDSTAPPSRSQTAPATPQRSPRDVSTKLSTRNPRVFGQPSSPHGGANGTSGGGNSGGASAQPLSSSADPFFIPKKKTVRRVQVSELDSAVTYFSSHHKPRKGAKGSTAENNGGGKMSEFQEKVSQLHETAPPASLGHFGDESPSSSRSPSRSPKAGKKNVVLLYRGGEKSSVPSDGELRAHRAAHPTGSNYTTLLGPDAVSPPAGSDLHPATGKRNNGHGQLHHPLHAHPDRHSKVDGGHHGVSQLPLHLQVEEKMKEERAREQERSRRSKVVKEESQERRTGWRSVDARESTFTAPSQAQNRVSHEPHGSPNAVALSPDPRSNVTEAPAHKALMHHAHVHGRQGQESVPGPKRVPGVPVSGEEKRSAAAQAAAIAAAEARARNRALTEHGASTDLFRAPFSSFTSGSKPPNPNPNPNSGSQQNGARQSSVSGTGKKTVSPLESRGGAVAAVTSLRTTAQAHTSPTEPGSLTAVCAGGHDASLRAVLSSDMVRLENETVAKKAERRGREKAAPEAMSMLLQTRNEILEPGTAVVALAHASAYQVSSGGHTPAGGPSAALRSALTPSTPPLRPTSSGASLPPTTVAGGAGSTLANTGAGPARLPRRSTSRNVERGGRAGGGGGGGLGPVRQGQGMTDWSTAATNAGRRDVTAAGIVSEVDHDLIAGARGGALVPSTLNAEAKPRDFKSTNGQHGGTPSPSVSAGGAGGMDRVTSSHGRRSSITDRVLSAPGQARLPGPGAAAGTTRPTGATDTSPRRSPQKSPQRLTPSPAPNANVTGGRPTNASGLRGARRGHGNGEHDAFDFPLDDGGGIDFSEERGIANISGGGGSTSRTRSPGRHVSIDVSSAPNQGHDIGGHGGAGPDGMGGVAHTMQVTTYDSETRHGRGGGSHSSPHHGGGGGVGVGTEGQFSDIDPSIVAMFSHYGDSPGAGGSLPPNGVDVVGRVSPTHAHGGGVGGGVPMSLQRLQAEQLAAGQPNRPMSPTTHPLTYVATPDTTQAAAYAMSHRTPDPTAWLQKSLANGSSPAEAAEKHLRHETRNAERSEDIASVQKLREFDLKQKRDRRRQKMGVFADPDDLDEPEVNYVGGGGVQSAHQSHHQSQGQGQGQGQQLQQQQLTQQYGGGALSSYGYASATAADSVSSKQKSVGGRSGASGATAAGSPTILKIEASDALRAVGSGNVMDSNSYMHRENNLHARHAHAQAATQGAPRITQSMFRFQTAKTLRCAETLRRVGYATLHDQFNTIAANTNCVTKPEFGRIVEKYLSPEELSEVPSVVACFDKTAQGSIALPMLLIGLQIFLGTVTPADTIRYCFYLLDTTSKLPRFITRYEAQSLVTFADGAAVDEKRLKMARDAAVSEDDLGASIGDPGHQKSQAKSQATSGSNTSGTRDSGKTTKRGRPPKGRATTTSPTNATSGVSNGGGGRGLNGSRVLTPSIPSRRRDASHGATTQNNATGLAKSAAGATGQSSDPTTLGGTAGTTTTMTTSVANVTNDAVGGDSEKANGGGRRTSTSSSGSHIGSRDAAEHEADLGMSKKSAAYWRQRRKMLTRKDLDEILEHANPDEPLADAAILLLCDDDEYLAMRAAILGVIRDPSKYDYTGRMPLKQFLDLLEERVRGGGDEGKEKQQGEFAFGAAWEGGAGMLRSNTKRMILGSLLHAPVPTHAPGS